MFQIILCHRLRFADSIFMLQRNALINLHTTRCCCNLVNNSSFCSFDSLWCSFLAYTEEICIWASWNTCWGELCSQDQLSIQGISLNLNVWIRSGKQFKPSHYLCNLFIANHSPVCFPATVIWIRLNSEKLIVNLDSHTAVFMIVKIWLFH